MKRISYLLFTVLILFSVKAYAPMAVSMNPPKAELDIKAGKGAKEVIELENKDYKAVKFKVYKTGFAIGSDGSLDFSSQKKNSAEAWITFVPDEVEVKPYDFGVVRYDVKVPEGTLNGSYTSAIMVEEIKEEVKGEERAQFIVKGRFAHIIYVNVGKPDQKVNVESISVSEDGKNIKFAVRIKNSGRYFFRPEGVIKIEQGGKKVKEAAIPSLPLLGETGRTIEMTVPKDFGAGKFDAVLEMTGGLKARKSFSIAGKG